MCSSALRHPESKTVQNKGDYTSMELFLPIFSRRALYMEAKNKHIVSRIPDPCCRRYQPPARGRRSPPIKAAIITCPPRFLGQLQFQNNRISRYTFVEPLYRKSATASCNRHDVLMEQRIRVWLPAIRGGSGVDIHTKRLAQALQCYGVGAEISWFSTYFQFAPFLLAGIAPPPGANIVHALSWSGYAFKRKNLPLVVSEQLDVLDPVYRPYKSVAQAAFHQTFVRRFMKKSFAAASAVTAVSQA